MPSRAMEGADQSTGGASLFAGWEVRIVKNCDLRN